jgi:hypothetical protein
MIMSGSATSTNFCQASSMVFSSSKEITWDPTMFAQVLSVNTFLMNASDSPGNDVSCIGPANEEVRTLASHKVCNLDDRVDLCFGKDTLTPGTFDIEAEDAQRGEPRPVPFGRVRNEAIPSAKRELLAIIGGA